MYRTLIKKELAEHTRVVCLMLAGFLLACGVALEYNRVAEYGVSPLQVVPVSLMSLLPLIAILLGQRLIVRENMGRTRQFVEALPISQFALVNVKFGLGLFLNSAFAMVVLALAASRAGQVDSIDSAYLSLLLLKTLSITSLTWSVVFCFSFCGFFRIVLYATLLVTILLLLSQPLFDASGFGPFALLQSGQFVFARDSWPWQDLLETWLLCGGFLLAGYAIAMINEGSLAESLSRSAGRREYVAAGLLSLTVLFVLGLLMEQGQQSPARSAGEFELRSVNPAVAVDYREAGFEPEAEKLLQQLSEALVQVRRRLAVTELPVLRLEHDQQLTEYEVRSDSNGHSGDRLELRANFNDLDEFAERSVVSATLHDLFQQLSGKRATFEPHHWVLDGVSRWWAEGGYANRTANQAELQARAVYTLQSLPAEWQLSRHWQLIADRTGYASATALAWSAIDYLANRQGADTVERLAREVLTRHSVGWSLATLHSKLNPIEKKFAAISGLSLTEFEQQWRVWLVQQATEPEVAAHLSRIPAISAQLRVEDQDGVSAARLYLSDSTLPDSAKGSGSAVSQVPAYQCRVQSERVSLFTHEMDWRLANEQTLSCHQNDAGVLLDAPYAAGDRVYVMVELLLDAFHEPLRLWSGRVSIP